MDTPIISVRAHAAVAHGSIVRNAIVRYPLRPSPSQPPVVIPFTAEIHSTTAINGVIVVAPANFALPSDLTTAPDLTDAGAFDRFLDRLAAAVPPLDPSIPAEVITIEF